MQIIKAFSLSIYNPNVSVSCTLLTSFENKVRYYKMEITLKNGFMCIGYPQIWNRLKDAKEFIKNNYNN